MTIYLYSGTPGSGKSLDAARQLYFQLWKDQPVICNFDVNLSAIRKDVSRFHHFLYLDNVQMTPHAVIDFCRAYWGSRRPKEGTIHLYLDECQLLFNSRDYRASDRMQWISFFSQHRKYGVDIVLIAQFDRMIDRQIRALIEYEIIHRCISNLGKRGAVLKLLMFGDTFVAIKRYYPLGELVGRSFFRGHRKFWRIYDTFATFVPADGDVEPPRDG